MNYASKSNKTAMDLERKYGPWARKAFFALNHYLYSLIMGLLCLPSFFYKYVALVQMWLYILIVLKNGADYYIFYFPKNYEKNLRELDKMEEELAHNEEKSTDSK